MFTYFILLILKNWAEELTPSFENTFAMPFFSVLVGFGILLLRARAVTPDSSLSPELKAGSEMNSRVAANLIKNSDLKGNSAWSPFSLGRAMGMLLLGAKVNSAQTGAPSMSSD